MRIRLMSDLHLESGRNVCLKNTRDWDVLILSGDILVADHFTRSIDSPYYRLANYYKDFIKQASDNYSHVIYVAGNHESYKGRFDRTSGIICDQVKDYDNFHYLYSDNIFVDIGDYRFCGDTLWTDFYQNPINAFTAQRCMNDFHVITNYDAGIYRKLSPDDVVSQHIRTLYDMSEAIKDHDNVIIVTHHAPTANSVHDKYKNDVALNTAYHSRLDDYILDRPQIKLWTHGHTHDSFDYLIGKTRVVCNPMGYPGEDNDYNHDLVIRV